MNPKIKLFIAVILSIVIIVFAIAIGSVYITPINVLGVILHKTFAAALPFGIEASSVPIVWDLRLPRVLLAFAAGSALSVSGVVMQSVLRNPMASSYTLGVSSGASLGAALVIFCGVTLPFAPALTLPFFGFLSALVTIWLVIALASRVGNGLSNNTIILTGIVLSLFINAVTTLLSAFAGQEMQKLLYWQMGSFSAKGWGAVWFIVPAAVIATLFILHFNRELDIMTFGEEQAITMGVNSDRTKKILLVAAAALTGIAVALSGVIGFVDLIAPHIVRRIFGSSHRIVIAMSALFGGAFMTVCDLAARTVISPRELPVGVITALIGAPFFAFLYFAPRQGGGGMNA